MTLKDLALACVMANKANAHMAGTETQRAQEDGQNEGQQ